MLPGVMLKIFFQKLITRAIQTTAEQSDFWLKRSSAWQGWKLSGTWVIYFNKTEIKRGRLVHIKPSTMTLEWGLLTKAVGELTTYNTPLTDGDAVAGNEPVLQEVSLQYF